MTEHIVERVARAINKVSCLAPVTEVAKAALEASHHAELVRLLKEARWYVKDSFINEIDALLAKIGGDAWGS